MNNCEICNPKFKQVAYDEKKILYKCIEVVAEKCSKYLKDQCVVCKAGYILRRD